MSDDADEKIRSGVTATMFGLIALVIGLDLLLDSRDGVGWLHVLFEGGVLVVALAGMFLMLRRFRRVGTDLALAREDAEHWEAENQSLLRGPTEAEIEIGFLLLKGLSHQEIADIRSSSERTAREQARSLYRKADISGRNELSAFFLLVRRRVAPVVFRATNTRAKRLERRSLNTCHERLVPAV